MSWRRPARKIVSPSRMSISLSSMKKVLVFWTLVSLMAVSPSPMSQGLGEFVGEEFKNAQQRVRRGLAKAADRRITHQRRELGEQRRIPRPAFHQLGGLLAADAAGRALAAALALE